MRTYNLYGLNVRKVVISAENTLDFKREMTDEPDTFKWINGFDQNSTFYDIGASNGVFSLYGGIAGHQVFAFEPSPLNNFSFDLHMKFNQDKIKGNVVLFSCAVGADDRLDTIYYANHRPGSHQNIVGSSADRHTLEQFKADKSSTVTLVSLDSWINKYDLPIPNYIKIDVDGYEMQCVEGMSNTLSSDSLKSLLIEISYPEGRGRSVMDRVESFGFKESVRHQVGKYQGLFNIVFNK